jgi:hypothetical protein
MGGVVLPARNSEIEIRTNSNGFSLFAVFEILNFEFVSDFDIRISDFSIRQTCLVPDMPG